MLFILMFFGPLLFGLAVEYALCRFPRRRFWRILPPVVSVLTVTAVTLFRLYGWSRDGSALAPIETLLFFPGVSGLGLFIGLFIGWRLWKRLWTPHVFTERPKWWDLWRHR